MYSSCTHILLYSVIFLFFGSLTNQGHTQDASAINSGDTISTISGNEYNTARVISKNASGVKLMTDSSIEKIGWDELTDESKEKLGYEAIQRELANIIEKREKIKEAHYKALQELKKKIANHPSEHRSVEFFEKAILLYKKNPLNKCKNDRLTVEGMKDLLGKPDSVEDGNLLSREYIFNSRLNFIGSLSGRQSSKPTPSYEPGYVYIYKNFWYDVTTDEYKELKIYFYKDLNYAAFSGPDGKSHRP